MNYEKAYKEALERAKYLKENTDSVGALDVSTCFENIFPELKESDDERIRKEIIKLVHFFYGSSLACKHLVSADDMISWLERQGGQKSVIKIEPIKEGLTDFQRCVSCLIASVMNKEYDYTQGFVEWAAQTLLGYAKHEIKTNWSEEDDRILHNVIAYVSFAAGKRGVRDDAFKEANSWLKSLKDKVQPRFKQEWSEEDEKKIVWLVRLISTAGYRELETDKMPCSRMELLEWLKSLKHCWKPTENQISKLLAVINDGNNANSESCHIVLQSLYNDIKNL